jgi:hypothetical protein
LKAWIQEPDLRINISKLLIDLDTLCTSINSSNSPNSQPSEIAINNSEISEEYEGLDIDSWVPINDGIEAHKAHDYEKAWKCFKIQAEYQNSLGKHWKARYLWEGIFVQQDKLTASSLFKEAADDGIVDAQYHYASCLTDEYVRSKVKVTPKDIIKYLRLAADNGSGPAQFQMGEMYFKGKLGYKQSEEMAILWYKRAALKNHKNAIKRLKELNANMD